MEPPYLPTAASHYHRAHQPNSQHHQAGRATSGPEQAATSTAPAPKNTPPATVALCLVDSYNVVMGSGPPAVPDTASTPTAWLISSKTGRWSFW
ncbi:hypothetical protein ACSBR2_029149 [Camellia fascicularis]